MAPGLHRPGSWPRDQELLSIELLEEHARRLAALLTVALELIGSSAGRLDAQRLQRFISAFQAVTPLTRREPGPAPRRWLAEDPAGPHG